MPKRIKTPPPPDDVRFFTIYQPYPLNANMESQNDRVKCARWIAEIIDQKWLIGILYRPRSYLGSILIEVDKGFTHTGRLLGEHCWAEFLVIPTTEESERFSQIFHSTYPSHREAQKDGWKTIDINDGWFREWKRGQGTVFKNPYPPTHWCDVPAEDRTNKSMCRPLPVAVKTPPEQPAPPVVGSSAWLKDKVAPNSEDPVVLSGAWAAEGRGAAPGTAQTHSSVQVKRAAAATSNGSSNGPIPDIATSSAKVGAWGKGKPSFPNIGTSPPPAASKPKDASVWGAPNPRITSSTASKPPGLSLPIKVTTKVANGAPLKANDTSDYNNGKSLPPPPGLSRSNNGTASSIDSTSTTSTLNDSTAADTDTNKKPFSWSDDVEGDMQVQGITVSLATSASIMDDLLAGSGDVVDEEEDPFYPSVIASSVPLAENLWDTQVTAATPKEEELVCSIHRDTPRVCKKGICRERARMEKERERQKAKEKQGAADNGGAKGGANSRGGRGKGGRKGRVNYQGTGGYESARTGEIAKRDDFNSRRPVVSGSRSPMAKNEDDLDDVLAEDETVSVWDS
ncbi:hypothetical protein Moror_9754 [Moniliophthora roreri MCA 2997]|uniref:Uncharacterized protein n=1 Tax=Moniliophthora roreri (strain MCA 2997) TaxID=1381753 RepID=V2X2F9_MONRO|nr:hypothetical protein Moror_9754 [Moniliophthora roreri MCA 2997]